MKDMATYHHHHHPTKQHQISWQQWDEDGIKTDGFRYTGLLLVVVVVVVDVMRANHEQISSSSSCCCGARPWW